MMPTDAQLEADALDRLPSDEPAQLQRSRLQQQAAEREGKALETATAWFEGNRPEVPDAVAFAVDDIEDKIVESENADDGL